MIGCTVAVGRRRQRMRRQLAQLPHVRRASCLGSLCAACLAVLALL